MAKKITIKDIAREAGVSIATVSYVLNNREDKRISEATKKKVLQIVNLFNYTCNFSAKYISSGKTNIVALYNGNADFDLLRAENYAFSELFCSALRAKGYSLRIADNSETNRLDNADAIICRDTETEFFRTVGGNNYVPLIALDSFIGDPLFFQINADYREIALQTEKIFGERAAAVSLPVNNAERRQIMQSAFPQMFFAQNYDDIRRLAVEYADKPLAVFGNSLYRYMSETGFSSLYRKDLYSSYTEKLIECIELTVNRQQIVNHDIRLS